jgi:hypothetical protein
MFEIGAHNIVMPLVDVATGNVVQVMAAVVVTGNEAVTIEPNEASRWHEPKTHKQYLLSPHRAHWRTGMELKMEQYESVPTWTLVDIRTVPKSTRIFRLKWAYAMKGVPMSTRLRFAPRLCLVGTGMDPAKFPSYADVGRKITLTIIASIYAAHMEDFTAHQADDANAFQNTVVDGSDGDKPVEKLYSYQAPDFEQEGPNKERLVCQHRTAFQGRIDSPKLYGGKVKPLLKQSGWNSLMYDPEGYIYHEGPTKGSGLSLPEILEKLRSAPPNSPGHAPPGYGLMVRHVDDKVMIVTSPKITEYMVGTFSNTYVCTYTGWKRVLGWDAVIDREERTVAFECPTVLLAARDRFLQDSVMISPKHIMGPGIMDLTVGEIPPEGHPDRPAYLIMQAEGASLLGLMIWITDKYPQGLFITRRIGQYAHCLSSECVRWLKYGLMHLIANPYAAHYGGVECRSLELSTPIK